MFKKKVVIVPTVQPETVQPEVQTPVEPIIEQEQEVVVEPEVVEAPKTEVEQPVVEPEIVPQQDPIPDVVKEIQDIVSEQLPASTQPVDVPIEKPKAKDKLEVDKFLFYKMMATCIKGSGYTGFAAMARFVAILGANKLEDQKAEWKKAQAYLRGEK